MAPKIKQNLLSLAIAVVMLFFVYYGINTFYSEPKYEDFCNQSLYNIRIDTEELCNMYGGRWLSPPALESPQTLYGEYICSKLPGSNETEVWLNCRPYEQRGYCDLSFYCGTEFSEAMEKRNRNVFIIAVILGIALIYLGGGILRLESVSSGIMGGGVLVVFYGVVKYWGFTTDAVRFAVLGIALFILIWLGYRRLNQDAGRRSGFRFRR
jgi:hypothetical protein